MNFQFGNSYLRINDLNDLTRLQDMCAEDSYYNYRFGETFACVNEGPLIFSSGCKADIRPLQRYLDQFAEGIYLGVQARVRIFVYEHWLRNRLKRALTFSGDYGWIRVEGEPEAWEDTWFFDGIDLHGELLYLQRISNLTERRRQETQIRHIFQSRQLEIDAHFPDINVEKTAMTLVRYFGFSI